ncbi:unnamed protein product, partial [Nesidiocoris tenuis]
MEFQYSTLKIPKTQSRFYLRLSKIKATEKGRAQGATSVTPISRHSRDTTKWEDGAFQRPRQVPTAGLCHHHSNSKCTNRFFCASLIKTKSAAGPKPQSIGGACIRSQSQHFHRVNSIPIYLSPAEHAENKKEETPRWGDSHQDRVSTRNHFHWKNTNRRRSGESSYLHFLKTDTVPMTPYVTTLNFCMTSLMCTCSVELNNHGFRAENVIKLLRRFRALSGAGIFRIYRKCWGFHCVVCRFVEFTHIAIWKHATFSSIMPALLSITLITRIFRTNRENCENYRHNPHRYPHNGKIAGNPNARSSSENLPGIGNH